MSEGVSLIIWPTTAKYSLISLWFYVLCQKLQKCCNGMSILKRAYLHIHWFKLCEVKSTRKPRRSTLLSLCNAKCDSYAVKRHTAKNPKLQNIATLLEPTVRSQPPLFRVNTRTSMPWWLELARSCEGQWHQGCHVTARCQWRWTHPCKWMGQHLVNACSMQHAVCAAVRILVYHGQSSDICH